MEQEDHSVWLESLLFHTLPAPVGAFMEHHAMPFIGAAPSPQVIMILSDGRIYDIPCLISIGLCWSFCCACRLRGGQIGQRHLPVSDWQCTQGVLHTSLHGYSPQ